MSALADAHCEPCRAGTAPLEDAAVARLLEELPGWSITRDSATPMLVRTFGFADFAAALRFANEIGRVADREDHHPRLVVEWGRVEVAWWTHAIGGLHRNDFVMAARSTGLAEQVSGPA